MHADRRKLIALAAGLALAVSGCGSNNDEPSVIEPPLGVLYIFPLDLPSPYDSPLPVAVTFNRATGLHEMQVSLFPVIDTGSFQPNSSTHQVWTWHDIQFDQADGCYFWLIDGVKLGRYHNLTEEKKIFLREPVVIRIPSSLDRFASVGFAGRVESLNPNVIASGTILFVMPAATTTFNPLEPGSFDPGEATAIAVANRYDDFPELPAPYSATMLPTNTAFIVVAITDTNNDLLYSPLDDWWGMYEDDAGLAAVVSAMNTGEKDSLYNPAANIVLQAPFVPPDLVD
jgi:hypothetical protein